MNKKINIITGLLVLCSPLVYGGSIVGSPHDIGGGGNNVAGDNGEICVYCHTPHAANVAFDGAPLWNKSGTASNDYMMYGATAINTAGTTIAGNATEATPSSPSLACLSCHDGISAIDSIVNAPGSGPGNLAAGTKNIGQLTTMFGGNIGGATGAPTSGTTVDLANDHPVSILYVENAASLRPKTTVLSSTNSGGTSWVGATTINDLLRAGRVECGSCHDPHNGGNTQGVSTEVNFLRHSNTGSQLCIGCHDK